MNKKFKLTDKKVKVNGRILYRIEALRNFNDVKKGDLGGYIEKEENLSHNGNCWVYDNACVYGNAWVHGNARIRHNAKIANKATVYGESIVYDNACVYGYAKIHDNALIYGNAHINMCGDVFGNARVCDRAMISDHAKVFGDAWICANACIDGIATVSSRNDYIIITGMIDDEHEPTVVYRWEDGSIRIKHADLGINNTLDEFIEEINNFDDIHKKEYLALVDLIKRRFNIKEGE